MTDRPRGVVRTALAHSAVRYLLVGGLSFCVDFGLLWLLHDALGIDVWLATGVAFLASFAVNYTLQRAFAFSSDAPHGGALVRYVVLVAVNTLIQVVLVTLIAATPVGWELGKVITTIITTVLNYFAYRLWVFRTPTGRATTVSEPKGE